jgi:hypothetical protein
LDATTVINLLATTGASVNSKGSSAISIGNNANTGPINIGTSATARTITIGNAASTAVNVAADNVAIDTDQAINLDATTKINLLATTGVDIDSKGSTAINIGTDTNTGAINIGTGASARTITVGSSSSTATNVRGSKIDLLSATGLDINTAGGYLNIATDSDSSTLNLGLNGDRLVAIGDSTGGTIKLNAPVTALVTLTSGITVTAGTSTFQNGITVTSAAITATAGLSVTSGTSTFAGNVQLAGALSQVGFFGNSGTTKQTVNNANQNVASVQDRLNTLLGHLRNHNLIN